jgi:hypothetical protein
VNTGIITYKGSIAASVIVSLTDATVRLYIFSVIRLVQSCELFAFLFSLLCLVLYCERFYPRDRLFSSFWSQIPMNILNIDMLKNQRNVFLHRDEEMRRQKQRVDTVK